MEQRTAQPFRTESLGLVRGHKLRSEKHLLPTQHFRLVGCWPRSITRQRLADGNLGQANILHDGLHDGQATGFGREGIDLIRALPDIAKQALVVAHLNRMARSRL
jgi:hypothetical protein